MEFLGKLAKKVSYMDVGEGREHDLNKYKRLRAISGLVVLKRLNVS